MDIDLSAPTSGEESLRGYFGTSLDTVYGGGGVIILIMGRGHYIDIFVHILTLTLEEGEGSLLW